jgi:hypothetical protein
MVFDSSTNHLYVGLDNGVVKIFVHNPDIKDKKRFVVRELPEPVCLEVKLLYLRRMRATADALALMEAGDVLPYIGLERYVAASQQN